MIEEKFKFEKLRIWKDAIDFGEEMNKMADAFPDKEKYNLSSQLRRAADSISLNIAEGSIFQSNKEQRKFMGYAIRSLAEVVTCLYKARKRDYISNEEFNNNYLMSYKLMNMMLAFVKTLKIN